MLIVEDSAGMKDEAVSMVREFDDSSRISNQCCNSSISYESCVMLLSGLSKCSRWLAFGSLNVKVGMGFYPTRTLNLRG